MADHTKGKLVCRRSAVYETIYTEDGVLLGFIGQEPLTQSAANAKRFVACWNACDGVSTETLEAKRGMFAFIYQEAFDSVSAESDRLRAALEEARAASPTTTPPQETEQARDAERLDWLDKPEQQGANLVSDDDGRWAISDSGVQPCAPDGGFTETVAISSWVEPHQWKPTVREAIDAAIAAQAKERSGG